jgi:hypothetical protein
MYVVSCLLKHILISLVNNSVAQDRSQVEPVNFVNYDDL